MSALQSGDRRLQRRHFLHAVSAGLTALGAAACTDESAVGVGPDEPTSPGAEVYVPVLVLYFEDPEFTDPAYVGEYRARSQDWNVDDAHASTAETRELIDRVRSETSAFEGLDPSLPASGDPDAAAVAALELRVLEDFEHARVVDVAGWTLARTEVDLCVLAWIL